MCHVTTAVVVALRGAPDVAPLPEGDRTNSPSSSLVMTFRGMNRNHRFSGSIEIILAFGAIA